MPVKCPEELDMGQQVNLADITALSIDERIILVQAIWDSIAAEADPLGLSDDQKRQLDQRVADLEANPDDIITWEEIKARVR
ncbi:MAG TPA: addiction module protein, partial [Isosphaeraceae bacterium]